MYLVISTKSFITLKVQEIESWNFVCPNTFRKCAWKQNFSHFGWEMTKISTVPKTMSCPENDVHDCSTQSYSSTVHCWSHLPRSCVGVKNLHTTQVLLTVVTPNHVDLVLICHCWGITAHLIHCRHGCPCVVLGIETLHGICSDLTIESSNCVDRVVTHRCGHEAVWHVHVTHFSPNLGLEIKPEGRAALSFAICATN